MPIYISRGRFTSDAVKGMLAKPENREEAVAKLFESVGGRLISWYLTFGHHDWLVIAGFPDEKAACLEGIVSKRIDAPCRRGPCKTWLKSKNLESEAVRRENEEDWG